MDNVNDNKYYKDGVALVLDLMRDTFKDYFKAYYNGQPDEVPQENLPCIMVSETEGRIESGATGTDNIQESILIVVSMNKKDDIGGDPDTDLTEFKLRKIVKGQHPIGHPNQQQYMENTVVYALRRYITMNQDIVSNEIETDFDVVQRGENTMQEAYVVVTLRRHAYVPVRS